MARRVPVLSPHAHTSRFRCEGAPRNAARVCYMRIALADVRGGTGFVSKDTVAGGFGSRLRPFSKVTRVVAAVKRRFHDLPSVQLAYAAALAHRAGHDVVATSGA